MFCSSVYFVRQENAHRMEKGKFLYSDHDAILYAAAAFVIRLFLVLHGAHHRQVTAVIAFCMWE
ncbi:MAG: hypothetical protein Q9226_005056 [Calogaya cf. arnoldii]